MGIFDDLKQFASGFGRVSSDRPVSLGLLTTQTVQKEESITFAPQTTSSKKISRTFAPTTFSVFAPTIITDSAGAVSSPRFSSSTSIPTTQTSQVEQISKPLTELGQSATSGGTVDLILLGIVAVAGIALLKGVGSGKRKK